MMTPAQMEKYLKRLLPMKNVTGPEAYAIKLRFQTLNILPREYWDCDDRAEYAARVAKQNGYKVRKKIQVLNKGLAHRYIEIAGADRVWYPILKKDAA